jgi:hypothetical protein
MSQSISAQSVQNDVACLRTAHRIRLNEAHAPFSLFINVVEVYAQAVRRSEANHLDGRRARHSRNRYGAGRRPNDHITERKGISGQGYWLRPALKSGE